MNQLKALAIRVSAACGLPRLIGPPVESRITTVLFHRFFFNGESKSRGKERLRRQLDWLRSEYAAISLSQTAEAFAGGGIPRRAALVTVDDGYTDLLEVVDVFKAFEVPVALFVCVGWTAEASPPERESLLARVVTCLEWYEGPPTSVAVGGGSLSVRLDRSARAEMIDRLLLAQDAFAPCLEELAAKLEQLSQRRGPRLICDWQELAQLRNQGVEIGCHSISHVRLAEARPPRLAFEVGEGKRLLQAKLGGCFAFAYPYGTEGTYNDETTSALKTSGFQLAFLTCPGFARLGTDPYRVPRLAMPNQDMSLAEFRARVVGGGVALHELARVLRVQ